MSTEQIHLGSRLQVESDTIRLLKADINYTTIYFKDGTHTLVSTTMGKIEKRLPEDDFLRVNRRTVINRSAISYYYIRPQFDEIELEDATFLKVSRRRKVIMRASLEHLL